MTDPMLERIALPIDEGDHVTDVIVIAVTQRMDAYGQAIYVSSTPHTGYVTQLGALEAALEEVRNPYIYGDDDE